ncbi:MAG: sugar phosphate isomerase/epimerase [Rhizobiales bacterium]|nr:sugar phosphate isomerase/epimerase [Hyphomicrobiales bacterium]NRB15444.1 sugar phosphate isomerase/epimerase [Hyphomicrobiales bacterium]
MKLSATAWSFPHLTLKEVGGVLNALGIDAIDVGLFYASALDKARILTEPEAYGTEIKSSLPIDIANYYHLFGNDLMERNLALGPNAENVADLTASAKFAKACGAKSLFILPGMINPGQGRKQALAASAEALKPLVEAGQKEGITVTIEPHIHGFLESVDLVQELLSKVPGLKITLDLAHFISLGYRQDELEALTPHAAHVHLRQSSQGKLQTKLEEGSINHPAFFADLRDAGYDGYLAIEYVHQAYMNTVFDDVLSETVKMRDCFNAWRG